MSDIKITVVGIEKIQAAINKFPQQISVYVGKAGGEVSRNVILKTPGINPYPPMTSANAPPYPYYQRGLGTWTSSNHNTGKSENLGKQWYVKQIGLDTEIGNRASYARWVHGDEQASFMKPKGWRILTEVVQEKIVRITKIYQAWITKCIRDLGL